MSDVDDVDYVDVDAEVDVVDVGVLELWPGGHRDLQRLPGGEILQGLLSTQGLGGTRSGLSARQWLPWFPAPSAPRVRPRPHPPAGHQTSRGGRSVGLSLSDLFFHCNLLS